jgi:hypothetical protein
MSHIRNNFSKCRRLGQLLDRLSRSMGDCQAGASVHATIAKHIHIYANGRLCNFCSLDAGASLMKDEGHG